MRRISVGPLNGFGAFVITPNVTHDRLPWRKYLKPWHSARPGDGESTGRIDPKQGPKFAQVLGVAINPIRPEKNLEIAEKMPDDEQNQDHARYRHDHFPADRRAMKGGDIGHKEVPESETKLRGD